jgi:hypothetical protein
MTNLFCVFLIFMTNFSMDQEKVIINLGDGIQLKVEILNSEEFSLMKESDFLFRVKNIEKDGVVRTFKNNENEIFLEFLDKKALRINSEEDLLRLGNVNFYNVYIPGKSYLSYEVKIDELLFQKNIEKSIEIKVGEELSFFGKFYKMESGNILVDWKVEMPNSKSRYSILNRLEDMVTFGGWELFESLNLHARTMSEVEVKEAGVRQDENINADLEMWGDLNRKNIQEKMAKIFNLDLEELDYSVESIKKIENSLQWNALDHSKIVIPCAFYFGEILIKEKSMRWIIYQGKYPLLELENGKEIDLIGQLDQSLISDNEGYPSMDWVILNILQEN